MSMIDFGAWFVFASGGMRVAMVGVLLMMGLIWGRIVLISLNVWR